ncbi:subclass B3 metallo-beta-lactamase [Niabella soli]|uniref:Beta-lactamase n=1 Tax=Niabella soli DSM 19437 TaxID=929713 RepID=W0EVG0_9BACT|nr:subclass B3 metallo-beta-lactamase [Niabella soli]AHF14790.1 beta-lactamase [Niabella soli DSM 19437]
MRIASFIFICSLVCSPAIGQKVVEPKALAEWSEPFAPFRIVGNLYYVGTKELACYLVTTPDGNILVNTGLAASLPLIKANIEALGFKFTNIKILLTNQVHYDHVGAMAAIKKQTGALMMVDAKDAAVLASGGASDYEMGKYGTTFAPVKADRLLKDGDTVSLGGTHLKLLHHPGHTMGSCSFMLDVKDNNKTYRVLLANMPTIIVDRKFSEVAGYPGIASDYAYTFSAMKRLSFDLWVAAHASQFDLQQKHPLHSKYNPGAFADRKDYDAALADLYKSYQAKIMQDK